MAGEIIKTKGIVLLIRPYSRTSHVVTWLTPDHGPVATLVKGAVRPKSAFLGQYDLFYTCELLYYAHASGDLHALREAVPEVRRDALRGRWRETSLAGYAAELMRALAPANGEARSWYDFLTHVLDELAAEPQPRVSPKRALVKLEMGLLNLAGVAPDFSGLDAHAEWTPFAVDLGRCGEGARTIRVSPKTVTALRGGLNGDEETAIRFLGLFLPFHLEQSPDMRRSLVALL